MAVPTKPERLAPIRAVYYTVNAHIGLGDSVTDWTPEQVAAEIRTLAGKSRAPRWDEAVEGYARLVEAEGADHLTWSVGQGSVWFSYGVEGLV